MSWTRAPELTAQVQRLWGRGDLLRYALQPSELFPFKLKFNKPKTAELTVRFESVREWVAHINLLTNYRIESRTFSHRVLGKNSLPAAIWLDDLPSAIAILDKQAELDSFLSLADRLMTRLPELLPWIQAHPVRVLSYESDWDHLLAIAEWIKRNPRPNLYLRQVDLPGLHTKFIEANSGLLSEWLDLVLPRDQINHQYSASTHFAARYGFKSKPVHIRFRLLDAAIWPAMSSAEADVSIDAAAFAALNLQPRYTFITENEVNFLAFPLVPRSIVIFGKGYGWEALAKARWLEQSSIVYWGDIDTHGFAILDQLRAEFPNVASLLMDQTTLMQHQDCWVTEEQQSSRPLARLTHEEAALYDALRRNAIRSNLRFEQERISMERLSLEIERLVARKAAP
jgi:hypothetical protein